MFYYRVSSTGEILGAAQSSSQDEDWLQRYAEALGLVAVVEFEADINPRQPDAHTEPPPVEIPGPPTLEERIAALETDIKKVVPDGAVAALPVLVVDTP